MLRHSTRFIQDPTSIVSFFPIWMAIAGLARSVLGLSLGWELLVGAIAAIFLVHWLFRDQALPTVRWLELFFWGVVPTLLLYHWPTEGLPAWHSGDASNHLFNLRQFYSPTLTYSTQYDRMIAAPAFYVYWHGWAALFHSDTVGLKLALYTGIFWMVSACRLLVALQSVRSRVWFAVALFFVVMPVLHYLTIEGFFRQFWSILLNLVFLLALRGTHARWKVGLIFSALMVGTYGLYAADLWVIALCTGVNLKRWWQGLLFILVLAPAAVVYFFLFQSVVMDQGGGLLFDPWNLCALFALALFFNPRRPLAWVALLVSLALIAWTHQDSYYALKYPLVPFLVLGLLCICDFSKRARWLKIPLLLCVFGFWISVGPVYLDRIFQRSEGSPMVALTDSHAFARLDEWQKQGAPCDGAFTWSSVPWPTRAFWLTTRTGKQAEPNCYLTARTLNQRN